MSEKEETADADLETLLITLSDIEVHVLKMLCNKQTSTTAAGIRWHYAWTLVKCYKNLIAQRVSHGNENKYLNTLKNVNNTLSEVPTQKRDKKIIEWATMTGLPAYETIDAALRKLEEQGYVSKVESKSEKADYIIRKWRVIPNFLKWWLKKKKEVIKELDGIKNINLRKTLYPPKTLMFLDIAL